MYLSLSRFPSSFKDTSHVELGTNLMMSPFFFLKDLIIYFIFVVLGLCCCTGFSLLSASGGSCLVVVCGLLIEVASFIVEHGLWA